MASQRRAPRDEEHYGDASAGDDPEMRMQPLDFDSDLDAERPYAADDEAIGGSGDGDAEGAPSIPAESPADDVDERDSEAEALAPVAPGMEEWLAATVVNDSGHVRCFQQPWIECLRLGTFTALPHPARKRHKLVCHLHPSCSVIGPAVDGDGAVLHLRICDGCIQASAGLSTWTQIV